MYYVEEWIIVISLLGGVLFGLAAAPFTRPAAALGSIGGGSVSRVGV
jgi:hypothetical protein